MAQKLLSQGLKKYAFSSAPQLKERNLLDPSSYDFQIRKQNTHSKGAISFSSKVASAVYVGRKRSGLSVTPGSLIVRGPGIREALRPLSDTSSSPHFPFGEEGKEVLCTSPLVASHPQGSLLSVGSSRKSRNGSAAKAAVSKGGGFNGKISSDSNPVGMRDGEELNRRYFIVGERRISSYWWASVFFFGGLGFLITGISSYIKYNLFTSVYRTIHNPFLLQGLSSPGGMEPFVNNGLHKLADFFKTLGAVEPFHSLSVLLFSFGVASSGQQPNLSPDPSEIVQNSQLLLSQPFLIQETGGESLIFFPQGLLLCFYGSLGLLLSLYWWLLIYWNVGGGFNEFNKKEGFMRIFRWGYPGKNRRIDIVYPLKDIEAIRVELNQTPGSGLLASEQTIFIRLLSNPQALNKEPTLFGEKNSLIEGPNLEKEIFREKRVSSSSSSGGATRVPGAEKLKVKREIPLGGIGQPLTLKEIEKQASELANYLQVALEGL